MKEEQLEVSLILLEILRGYSILYAKNKEVYFKHFLISENLALEEFEKNALIQAKRDGIKSEQQLIENAIKNKYWSKNLEDKIKSLNWMIQKSEQAAEKITDNIQRAAFNESINKQRREVSELQEKRDNIISYSAENCASHKKNLRLISTSVFYDKDFTQPISDEDSFLVMPHLRKRLNELSKEVNLIHAAYSSSFFDLYCLAYRDPLALIKRDVFTITVLQKNLLTYASMILNKLKNVEVPDDIREDPVKIIKYKKSEGSEVKKSEGIDDLREKMARSGGKLKAEDLLS